MRTFEEALRDIDSFCKVVVKKPSATSAEAGVESNEELKIESALEKNVFYQPPNKSSTGEAFCMLPPSEEPLVDVIDENDYVRILVQCRCREQEVTFHPFSDGIRICREECNVDSEGIEKCLEVCRKINLRTDNLQIEDMKFVIAKCNNNNTLEAMIPKIKSM
jgi:hypothetical protein